jgi:hypothetical protein
MLLDFISAKDALAMAEEARKHYREEERLSLLRSVDADIKDACKIGDLSTTVEVEEIDSKFLMDFLKEKGYNTQQIESDPVAAEITIEICWD